MFKYLKVTGLDAAPFIINKDRITHALSCVDPDAKVYHINDHHTLEDHKILRFKDVEYPDYWRPPTFDICEEIVEWFKTIPDEARILIHCHAGISRSTAATMALFYMNSMSDNKVTKAFYAGNEILRIRSIAVPNKLMATYFDRILDADGNLVKAVERVWSLSDLMFEDGDLHLRNYR